MLLLVVPQCKRGMAASLKGKLFNMVCETVSRDMCRRMLCLEFGPLCELA